MVLGLTGGYCSGKNAVAAILEQKGFTCFDIDELGHEALGLEESMEAIAWRFGPTVIRPDGSVDRRALADLVFGDAEGLADLEAIIHPAVYRLLKPRLAAALAAGHEACINAALLYRMPEATGCAAIMEVLAPPRVRIARGMARDGLTARQVKARIKEQRPLWKRRAESGRPVVFLRNCGGEDRLAALVEAALEDARAAAAAARPSSRRPSGSPDK
jgi:dephospho-CoA kinase